MTKLVKELRQFREREGARRQLDRPLLMEEAAAMVRIAGEASPNKTSWHAWEHGRKVPSPKFMGPLCDLIGCSSDIFYGRRPFVTPNTANDVQLSLAV